MLDTFYTAFQAKDYETMRSCYAKNAHFVDEVFDLKSDMIGFMWEMLCKRGKDLNISYTILNETDYEGEVRWYAKYTFSQTGRRVHNVIHARFVLQDGKITEHKDTFNFYRWARMALGWSGILLGWTMYLQNKVRKNAQISLSRFVEKKVEES